MTAATVICLVFLALFISAGLYFLITAMIPAPSSQAVSAVRGLRPRSAGWDKGFVFPVARYLQRFIRINPYTRRNIERQLQAADLDYTPEFYLASCFANSLLFLFPTVIMLPVMPLLSVPFLIAGVVMFFVTKQAMVSTAIKRHDRLEAEIPRFTESIVQSLAYRQDTEAMIRAYRKVSSREFGKELDILITNMRTSPLGRVHALLEFQRRMNSPMATQLVRGLIGIERGDDMKAFLESELIHMKDKRLSDLRKKADRRTGELAMPNLVLIMALIALALTMIGVQAFSSMKVYF